MLLDHTLSGKVLEQLCTVEHSEMIGTFYICAVQYGTVAIEYLACAGPCAQCSVRSIVFNLPSNTLVT